MISSGRSWPQDDLYLGFAKWDRLGRMDLEIGAISRGGLIKMSVSVNGFLETDNF